MGYCIRKLQKRLMRPARVFDDSWHCRWTPTYTSDSDTFCLKMLADTGVADTPGVDFACTQVLARLGEALSRLTSLRH